MKCTLLAIGILFAVTSCNTHPKTSTPEAVTKTEAPAKADMPDMHTSQNSLDWAGTYTGTLPCADCPGIEAIIVLYPDKAYEKTFIYQERKDATFKEKGKFTWNKEGNTITLDSKGNSSYRVKEGSIVTLDGDGNEITGALADKFVLKKK
ncbi:MAG: copper resistance protein NlpE [Ginsengibacter sp.]